MFYVKGPVASRRFTTVADAASGLIGISLLTDYCTAEGILEESKS